MSKRAVIYARVSYDDRPNEDRNLEGQIEDGSWPKMTGGPVAQVGTCRC